MTSHYLRRLFDHLFWADARVLDRLSSAPGTPGLQLFAHLLAAEQVWLARLERGDSTDLAIWPDLSLQQCADLSAENRAGYTRLFDTLTEDELTEAVTYQDSKGAPFRTARIDVLQHVALHGSYHRGQIVRALREGGAEPVATDYIAWVRLQG